MVYVLGRLKVENYEYWQNGFDERSAIRKESGSKEAQSSVTEIILMKL